MDQALDDLVGIAQLGRGREELHAGQDADARRCRLEGDRVLERVGDVPRLGHGIGCVPTGRDVARWLQPADGGREAGLHQRIGGLLAFHDDDRVGPSLEPVGVVQRQRRAPVPLSPEVLSGPRQDTSLVPSSWSMRT